MLELDGLSHRYETELALEEVSVGVETGELVALLGPSGCGKTTLVQAIAGHIRPTAGRVLLRGDDVTDEPPETRRVGVVFQQSTLFPHMTVRENVAYGLGPLEETLDSPTARIEDYLEMVSLGDQQTAYPDELSGGQQRRAELARALAPQPDVLVLDEPLSALDRALRVQLREEIAHIQRETGVTTLFVTHDQDDAMALADTLVVMNDGHIAGSGCPRTLYQSPPNAFVASFLGRSNLFPVPVVDDDPLTITLGEGQVTFDNVEGSVTNGGTVDCHIRPEAASLATGEVSEESLTVSGEVVDVTDVGRRYDVTVRTTYGDLLVEQSESPPPTGETLSVGLPAEKLSLVE